MKPLEQRMIARMTTRRWLMMGVALAAVAIASLALAGGHRMSMMRSGMMGYGGMAPDMMGWGGQFPDAPVGDREHGRRLAEAACAACHGADGNSSDPQYPKLAGQAAGNLCQELWAFKAGDRQSDVMAKIVAALADADVVDVASFYSQQAIRPDTVKDTGLAAVGQRIFFAGTGSSEVPACAMCHRSAEQAQMHMMGHGMMGHGMMHSMPMMGMPPNATNLNGQHAAYIVNQLNRFASGQREGVVMDRIAPLLSETDKNAVAEYLSGLQ
jgi:cytochrome c553